MLDVDDLTAEQLLAAWREAVIAVNGTAIGTAEHEAALQQSEKAREACQLRREAMKDDLRDG
jgi:hypothetical protein